MEKERKLNEDILVYLLMIDQEKENVFLFGKTKFTNSIFAGMIMGAAGSTVYYNLRLRHPTMDLPIIDYDLALLFQPMLMLGISIGVAFNVIFPDWMVTVLLIILFLGIYYLIFIHLIIHFIFLSSFS